MEDTKFMQFKNNKNYHNSINVLFDRSIYGFDTEFGMFSTDEGLYPERYNNWNF